MITVLVAPAYIYRIAYGAQNITFLHFLVQHHCSLPVNSLCQFHRMNRR